MASALPPTATSTMNTKRLVAATAERVSPCLGPDAVAGAEDALGIASGDAATAPSAGLCVDFGVGPAGVLVGVLFGATTAMATVLQSLIVESAEADAHTWCLPVAGQPGWPRMRAVCRRRMRAHPPTSRHPR